MIRHPICFNDRIICFNDTFLIKSEALVSAFQRSFSSFSNTDMLYLLLALFDFASSAHVDLSRLDDKRIRDGSHNSVGNQTRRERHSASAPTLPE